MAEAEWLAGRLMMMGARRLIRRAGAAYQSVVPVVPVVPLVGGAMYPFPDPEGCGHFGKAIVGGWIVSILASVLTGGIGIPVLIVLNLYCSRPPGAVKRP
jgi:hypothetical protein